ERKISSLSVVIIPQNDPDHPSSLCGQKGVKNTSTGTISKYTLLGEFAGQMGPCRYIGHNNYSFCFQIKDETMITINPVKGGNQCLEYINDYRIDVKGSLDWHNGYNRINCQWLVIRHQNNY